MDEALEHLYHYSLHHPSPDFIHQHVVDVSTAQWADENTKPISLLFSLVGLCLYLEHGFTGKQIQFAHMKLAKHKDRFPGLTVNTVRCKPLLNEVLRAPAGEERDAQLKRWCSQVWNAYKAEHANIRTFLKEQHIVK